MIWQKIKKSELIKNTSILVTGTILAQLISILLQPILRRYYSPEIFGAFAIYSSLIGILIVVSSFKYELAIILPQKDKEAANILFLGLFINLVFNIILLFIVLIFRTKIVVFLNLPEQYSFYLILVPLGTFLFNFYENINYWLIRKKEFLNIAKNKLIRRSTEGIGQIGFKLINIPNGLVWGNIIGHISNIISGIYQGFKGGFKLSFISFTKIKYVFKKYSEYPKYNVIPSLLSTGSYLLPALFINKFFSTDYTGFFDLSKLVLSIPLAFIATSLSNVLLQRISEKYKNKKSIVKELYPIIGIIVLIIVFEITVILLYGEELFVFVFGKRWNLSGTISKILVWSYAFNFLISSFYSLFISMKKIKLLSIWQVFYFLSIIILILFRNYSFINFIKIYVLIEILCYVVITVLMVSIVVKYESGIRSSFKAT